MMNFLTPPTPRTPVVLPPDFPAALIIEIVQMGQGFDSLEICPNIPISDRSRDALFNHIKQNFVLNSSPEARPGRMVLVMGRWDARCPLISSEGKVAVDILEDRHVGPVVEMESDCGARTQYALVNHPRFYLDLQNIQPRGKMSLSFIVFMQTMETEWADYQKSPRGFADKEFHELSCGEKAVEGLIRQCGERDPVVVLARTNMLETYKELRRSHRIMRCQPSTEMRDHAEGVDRQITQWMVTEVGSYLLRMQDYLIHRAMELRRERRTGTTYDAPTLNGLWSAHQADARNLLKLEAAFALLHDPELVLDSRIERYANILDVAPPSPQG